MKNKLATTSKQLGERQKKQGKLKKNTENTGTNRKTYKKTRKPLEKPKQANEHRR